VANCWWTRADRAAAACSSFVTVSSRVNHAPSSLVVKLPTTHVTQLTRTLVVKLPTTHVTQLTRTLVVKLAC
jgi:hypothetical protein